MSLGGWWSGKTEADRQREEQGRIAAEARLEREEKERKDAEARLRREEEDKLATKVRLFREERERKQAEERLREEQDRVSKIKEQKKEIEKQLQQERENSLKELHERQEREIKEKAACQERERASLKDKEEALEALKVKQRAEILDQERIFKQEIQERERLIKEELQEKEQILQELTTKEQRLREFEAKKQEDDNRKLKEPWRSFERDGGWNIEYHDQLLKEIQNLKPPGNLKKGRILFIGPIRAGKSSFINSVASIDKDSLTSPMEAGSTKKSLTLTLRQHILKNYVLMDVMGVEEQDGQGFHTKDIIYLMEGNIQTKYMFNPRTPISESDASFNRYPGLADKVHCVVFVMDAHVIHSDSVSDVSKTKINTLLKHIRDHEVPVMIVITQIDEICPEVKTDVARTYHSRAVESCFNKAFELFGVPKMNIFPVQNYSSEVELNVNQSILLMLALRKMMQLSTDRLQGNDDQNYGKRGYYQSFRQNCELS